MENKKCEDMKENCFGGIIKAFRVLRDYNKYLLFL